MHITFEFATKDDCLDKMVPSDLRQLVCERDNAIKELDALAAQVESARNWLTTVTQGECVCHSGQITGYVVDYDKLDEIGEILDKPSACLAHVRAEATKDGYIQGVAEYQESEDLRTDFDLHSRANQCAERILREKK